jgi:hypothetical protein
MKRNVPYAIIVPIAVVSFAIVLMLWAMKGSNNSGQRISPAETTGNAARPSKEQPVRVPTMPGNDASSDPDRTPNYPPVNERR